MHRDAPANGILDGPVTTLLSALCILVEVLSRAQAKKGESLNHFKFGTCIGSFSSDGAASTAVKGLKPVWVLSYQKLVQECCVGFIRYYDLF